ncbi:MAG TPA: citrate/2-methylcitrate synthase [Candidatus Dojkabacteria bacterium]|nr:citrate/2-methylcitrate synthase [Candidatus Dojkabacteria bacterium]
MKQLPEKPLFSRTTQAIFYNEHPQPIQNMLDYDWLCRKKNPSIIAVVNPNHGGFHKCFFGGQEIILPVYKSIVEAINKHPEADVFVNFASYRSAFETSKQAILSKTIRTVAITAEGMRENETRELIRLADSRNKWLIGPATVGAIRPGDFKIGNTGGTIENIIESRLYRKGSVAVVAVSGGMSNELYHVISENTDGVYEGIAIGGDKFPGSTLLENILRLAKEPGVKMLVTLGEIGGTAEYEVVAALKKKHITKPVVAWVIGTVASLFPTEVQFGHAGARSGVNLESAQAKNTALKQSGAFVPKSYNDLGLLIKKVFQNKVQSAKNYQEPEKTNYQMPPLDFTEAVKNGVVRKASSITSSISDDRGEEFLINKTPLDAYLEKPLGHLINALWFKGLLNKTGEQFLELCLKLAADHGPAVATTHNAIVTARAGKDLVSSLISGLATIGPRHGGAIDVAAQWIFSQANKNTTPQDFVSSMKVKGELIMGIGHRTKSVQNPDHRVTVLKKFAKKNLKQIKYLDYALAVETETLKKKNNLILNVDGAIAAVFLDILKGTPLDNDQIFELLKMEIFNALFVLSRSIGIIGHIIDQKRLGTDLYRHAADDILYL